MVKNCSTLAQNSNYQNPNTQPTSNRANKTKKSLNEFVLKKSSMTIISLMQSSEIIWLYWGICKFNLIWANNDDVCPQTVEFVKLTKKIPQF